MEPEDECNIQSKTSHNSLNILSSTNYNLENSISSQKKWNSYEDKQLLCTVEKYKEKGEKINWLDISNQIEGKNKRQCYTRYTQINPKFNKGNWSKEEDEKLKLLVSQFGNKWSLIASNMKTRSSKQIRDRYINYIDNSILKTPFSANEDKLIVELIHKYGSNWSLIAKEISGRTGDHVKNRFNWAIKQNLSSEALKKISNLFY